MAQNATRGSLLQEMSKGIIEARLTGAAHLSSGSDARTGGAGPLRSHDREPWRGKPLITHQVIVNLIAATTTKAGLKVRAEIDPSTYPKGRKIKTAEMAKLNIVRDEFHGEWNYTLHPRGAD